MYCIFLFTRTSTHLSPLCVSSGWTMNRSIVVPAICFGSSKRTTPWGCRSTQRVLIESLEKFYFRQPAAMPIAVRVAGRKGENPLDRPLCRLSPLEPIAAMFSAIAKAVNRNDSDESLEKWRKHLLSVPFEFACVNTEDERYFAALQLRENITKDYESMRVSVLMRIMDIESFLHRKEKQQAKCRQSNVPSSTPSICSWLQAARRYPRSLSTRCSHVMF